MLCVDCYLNFLTSFAIASSPALDSHITTQAQSCSYVGDDDQGSILLTDQRMILVPLEDTDIYLILMSTLAVVVLMELFHLLQEIRPTAQTQDTDTAMVTMSIIDVMRICLKIIQIALYLPCPYIST